MCSMAASTCWGGSTEAICARLEPPLRRTTGDISARMGALREPVLQLFQQFEHYGP